VYTSSRELGIQLRRDVKPALDAAGVKLFLVSIGTWERSGQFAEVTGFPRECLLADPGSVTYEALGLVKGVRQTFFGAEVCVGRWALRKSRQQQQQQQQHSEAAVGHQEQQWVQLWGVKTSAVGPGGGR
jgi:hypothetical protein